jgi:hypothetical protein
MFVFGTAAPRGGLTPQPRTTSEKFDDDDYPAYTMGRAAEMLGVTPAFLRALDEGGLVNPQRSTGGHRRYSRRQLRLAARARHLLDEGMPMVAACRIVVLEDRLDAAHRRLSELDPHHRPSGVEPPAA